MSAPKWVIPVVAVSAAVVIGMTATVVGMTFASPTQQARPAGTISVPQLAPVLIPDDPNATLPISPTTGKRMVTRPGAVAPGTSSPRLVREINDLNAMDDPAGSGEAATGGSGASASGSGSGTPADDPCSASPVLPTCPGGAPAVVVGNRLSQEQFLITADSYPPAPAAHSGSYFSCPATAVTATSLPFTFVTTAPATVEIDYWPLSNASDVHHLSLPTSPADAAAYQAGLTAYHGPDGGYSHVINHCANLTDLEPQAIYAFQSHAEDALGRDADRYVQFQLRDLRQRPPTRVTPVGTHTLNVRASRTPDEELQVGVYALPDSVAATCADGIAHGTAQRENVPVAVGSNSADFLSAGDWLPDYTISEAHTFAVSSGSRIVVCVRWFAAGHGPDRAGTPTYQSQYVLTTPSVRHPSITIVRLDLTRSIAAGGVEVGAFLPDGEFCGDAPLDAATVPGTLTARTRIPVCTLTDALAGANGGGGLTLRTETRPGATLSSHIYVSTAGIPDFADAECGDAGCPVPAPQDSVVPIGEGDGSVGTMVVEVSWADGPITGTGGWTFGEFTEGDYDAPLPAQIAIDQTQEPTIVDAHTGHGDTMGFVLRADRPVRWTAQLLGSTCSLDSTGLRASSTTLAAEGSVNITGLCPGDSYSLRLVLTAADGTTTVWHHLEDGRFWPQGFFTAPGVAGTLIAGYEIRHAPSSYRRGLSFQVNGYDDPEDGLGGSSCTGYDLASGHVIAHGAMPWQQDMHLRLRLTDCETGHLMELNLGGVPMTLLDLQHGATFTQTATDAGWDVTVTVSFLRDPAS